MVLDGYQMVELEAAGEMQPNWYAHFLWTLYKDISKIFMQCLTEEDLHQGVQLSNPLTIYIQETSRCKAFYASGVPPALMGSMGQPQVQSDDKMSEKGWYRKRKQKGGGQDDLDIIKKQKQQDRKGSQWRDNKIL